MAIGSRSLIVFALDRPPKCSLEWSRTERLFGEVLGTREADGCCGAAAERCTRV